VNAYSKITNEGIEDSDQGADMWVMGAYNGLSRMYVYDEFPRCLELDNDYVTGPSWAFGELGAGNFQGATNQSDAVWKLSFELVNRTNEAIYHVEKMKNVSVAAKTIVWENFTSYRHTDISCWLERTVKCLSSHILSIREMTLISHVSQYLLCMHTLLAYLIMPKI